MIGERKWEQLKKEAMICCSTKGRKRKNLSRKQFLCSGNRKGGMRNGGGLCGNLQPGAKKPDPKKDTWREMGVTPRLGEKGREKKLLKHFQWGKGEVLRK